jgi:hypothetical protein
VGDFRPLKRSAISNTYPSAQSGKEDRFISDLFSADAFNLLLAAFTEKVKADAVFLWLDQLAEAIAELRILSSGEAALKHTVLHPLAVGLENGVDFGAPLVF